MDKLEQLITSGIARGISEDEIRVAIKDGQQGEGMARLRKLGFSLTEIGRHFDLTRQRVSQILGSNSGKIAIKVIEADPEKIKAEIWAMASNDLEWWGKKGKLSLDKAVGLFRGYGYTWAKGRELAKIVQGSKLDVILSVSFDVEPNNLAHTAFFNVLAINMVKYDILYHINSKQPLTVSKRLFDRKWAEMGLHAKKRDYG